jgi:signal transduction histidine kinase
MRTLLLELRPRALEQTGLDELLKQLAHAASGRARIPVATRFSGCGDIPFEVKLGMYRIAQEALNNVVKHAQASSVEVLAQGTCGGEGVCAAMVLEIVDDGVGFAMEDIQGGHFGVDIMRERAEVFGGSLRVHSSVGGGTRIRVCWPDETVKIV